jgi:Fe-S oxidoreductase
VKDTELNRERTPCCGSGGGVRSLYRDLSAEMASRLLKMAPEHMMVSTCPFCTFQLRSTARGNERDKEVTYFATIVLDSLKH